MRPSAPNSPGVWTMTLYALMVAGGITVDAITATMLQITARHFTDNITLIAVMVALNRVCGVFVQPYAAWKSDRHRGPRGRRRPFFLFGWPATLVAVGLLGALPFLLPAGLHRTLFAVTLFFLVNLALQAALDVCFGCGEPLYGDTFSSRELGRAAGIRGVVFSAVGMAMAYLALPLADRHEFVPYAMSMAFLLISSLIAGFFLRERLPTTLPPAGRYEPWRPLAELRDRRLAWVATVASCTLTADALATMLHALFVVETLQLTKTHLGQVAAVGIALRFALSFPAGLLVDRFGARPVLCFGFACIAAASLGLAFAVHALPGLYVCVAVLAIGSICSNTPIIPITFREAPPERRGSIFAAVQITRGIVVSLATIVVGSLADAFASYRLCYVATAAVCVIGIVASFKLGRRTSREPILSDGVNDGPAA